MVHVYNPTYSVQNWSKLVQTCQIVTSSINTVTRVSLGSFLITAFRCDSNVAIIMPLDGKLLTPPINMKLTCVINCENCGESCVDSHNKDTRLDTKSSLLSDYDS